MNPGAPAVTVIRVLLVDDSPVAVELVKRMLAPAPDILVVGAAANGAEALPLIPRLRPDVICTDLHMPRMDGLEFIRAVMIQSPLPILVLSVSVQAEQAHNIFRTLEAGAIDILAKPRGGMTGAPASGAELIQKIRVLSGVRVIGGRSSFPQRAAVAAIPLPLSDRPAVPPRIIGIGASTGGPQALVAILQALPPDFEVPVVCVQHISDGFSAGLMSWLGSNCRIRVQTAQDGASPQAGFAYLPAEGRHLEVDGQGLFRGSQAPPTSGHRPSIDVTFNSLASHYRDRAAGVLLTGMGEDGARGLLAIRQAGGLTIVQDQASCVVFGMPRCAIEIGAARHVLPLPRIGPTLRGLTQPANQPEQPHDERTVDEPKP